jgi:hypothetical protein
VALAYAQSAAPPTQPANNVSRFSIHNSHQRFSVDLKAAQNCQLCRAGPEGNGLIK